MNRWDAEQTPLRLEITPDDWPRGRLLDPLDGAALIAARRVAADARVSVEDGWLHVNGLKGRLPAAARREPPPGSASVAFTVRLGFPRQIHQLDPSKEEAA